MAKYWFAMGWAGFTVATVGISLSASDAWIARTYAFTAVCFVLAVYYRGEK